VPRSNFQFRFTADDRSAVVTRDGVRCGSQFVVTLPLTAHDGF